MEFWVKSHGPKSPSERARVTARNLAFPHVPNVFGLREKRRTMRGRLRWKKMWEIWNFQITSQRAAGKKKSFAESDY